MKNFTPLFAAMLLLGACQSDTSDSSEPVIDFSSADQELSFDGVDTPCEVTLFARTPDEEDTVLTIVYDDAGQYRISETTVALDDGDLVSEFAWVYDEDGGVIYQLRQGATAGKFMEIFSDRTIVAGLSLSTNSDVVVTDAGVSVNTELRTYSYEVTPTSLQTTACRNREAADIDPATFDCEHPEASVFTHVRNFEDDREVGLESLTSDYSNYRDYDETGEAYDQIVDYDGDGDIDEIYHWAIVQGYIFNFPKQVAPSWQQVGYTLVEDGIEEPLWSVELRGDRQIETIEFYDVGESLVFLYDAEDKVTEVLFDDGLGSPAVPARSYDYCD